MHTTPHQCPICGETLLVTGLTCPACDTGITGRYRFSRLEELTPEQLDFVELFVRCEGKLSWVQQELKSSYPTVRAKLDEVIRSMGYEVRELPPVEESKRNAEARQAVLNDLASGRITSAEAIQRLQEGSTALSR